MKIIEDSPITQNIEEDSELTDLLDLTGHFSLLLDEDSVIVQTVKMNSALDLEGY